MISDANKHLIASENTLKVLVIGNYLELVEFLKDQSYLVEVFNPANAYDQNLLNTQQWDGAQIAPWIPAHQKLAFRIYRFLKTKDYNVIFFPEHNGNGYYLTEAKKQGYGFEKTILVSYLTEPSEWLWDISNIIAPDICSYLQAESEQKSVEQADVAIIPSNYAYNILNDKGWKFPSSTKILQPLYKILNKSEAPDSITFTNKLQEIIFIGPPDFRHGYDLFLKTIRKAYTLSPEDMKGIKITVLYRKLTKQQTVDLLHSEQDLPNINHISNVDYIRYIQDPSRLIIFTSREEVGSYREYIALYEGARFIGMNDGFLEEIIESETVLAPHLNTSALANMLINELRNPTYTPKPKKSLQEVFLKWKDTMKEIELKVAQQFLSKPSLDNPFVSVCITHFNRPEQLMEALNGFVQQTYQNFEVIVMDDGSKFEVIHYLKREVEPFMHRRNWRIFYQDNKFISNARNNLVNYAKGPLLLFFEDDDIPIPDAIERLVCIKQKTGADIVNTNIAFAAKDKFKVDELSLVPGSYITSIIGENHIGFSAIALIAKDLFQKLGGYLDIYGFIYSDYEFYLRGGLNNAKIVTSLEPTYIYNFVGQDHYVYEALKAQFYQTRIVLNAYKHVLPKKFRNIPFWMYSLEQENERLTKENQNLYKKINKLTHKIPLSQIIYFHLRRLYKSNYLALVLNEIIKKTGFFIKWLKIKFFI